MNKKAKVAVVLVGVGIATLFLAKNAEAAPEPRLASLSGAVSDASTGQPVQGVSVTLGTLSTSTNSSGGYSFNNVVPGRYVLTFDKSGYQTATF